MSETSLARRRGLPREGTGRRPVALWTVPCFPRFAVRFRPAKQPPHRRRSPSATDV